MSFAGGGGGGSTSFDQPQQQLPLLLPLHCPSPSQQQVLLHRSPSGAQRKIRQKAVLQQQQQHQFQHQQQFPLTTNGYSAAHSSYSHPQMPSYRSLIHENGYKSILGGKDNNPNPNMGEEQNPSVGQLIDRMNRLDTVNVEPSSWECSPPTPTPPTPSLSSCWMAGNGVGGGGGGSIDKMAPSSASFASMLADHHHQQQQRNPNQNGHQKPQQQQQQQPPSYPSSPTTQFANKPTVQVHPLPVPPRHRSMSVIAAPASPTKPTPPPLPPKKNSLKQKGPPTTTLIGEAPPTENGGGEVAYEEVGEMKGTGKLAKPDDDGGFKAFRWVSPASTVPPSPSARTFSSANFGFENGMENCQNGTTSPKWRPMAKSEHSPTQKQPMAAATSPSVAASTPPLSFFSPIAVSPPHSLSSSPSLTSLQNSLLFAADNPEKHSREQLLELEQRRLQSIESLTRKIADREQDRELLCRDLDEIGHIRAELFARIGHSIGGMPTNNNLVARLSMHLAQTEKMADLEVRMQCQLERTKQRTRNKDGGREGEEPMVRHIREQLGDLHFMRRNVEERQRALDADVADALGEGLQEWLFCREQIAKLCAERSHLNERLRDVRTLLGALEGICLKKSGNEEENGGKSDQRM